MVEIGDDTPQPIVHVGEAPFNHVAQNVLHVPTITKNLVSVGQIIDQGMQVQFTHLRCFIEEEGQIIVQGRRDGTMFILDTNDVGTAMLSKAQKTIFRLVHRRLQPTDMDLPHKKEE